ncbi:hypothetical protein Y032_0235g3170 [Ancylostoma ceylanicum]|uniref:C-type lectin domain-containing protein n=1 Tax=Ancylostoma ceylanicum TaxID=53326 RepID=A0A016SEY0_9BILA|nr:hypothetical protein Y032_0235g3170 [Ancylostoma ceylanicum]
MPSLLAVVCLAILTFAHSTQCSDSAVRKAAPSAIRRDPKLKCQNGGVLDARKTSCFCPPGYAGGICENIVCYNGGTANRNQCKCEAEWSGKFCEIPKCLKKGISPETMLSEVDMVFMVELTEQAHDQLKYFNEQFAEIIRDIQQQNLSWIKRFHLVAFNSTWADVLVTSSINDPHRIIEGLNKLRNSNVTDTGCHVKLWEGFQRVLQLDPPAGSLIEVFLTSTDDSDNSDRVETVYEKMRHLYINVNVFLSHTTLFKPNGFACNATQDDYNNVYLLTGGAIGKVFPVQPRYTRDVAQIIPLQYQNAEVYRQRSDHCGKPMDVYFPVDAYTQTIQLNTLGYQKYVRIYDGKGRKVDGFTLLRDSLSDWDIYDIRGGCGEGWQQVGQYCLQFVVLPRGWHEARDYCHEIGANLIDDLNREKHDFLADVAHGFDFWLGLYNNGSGYLWDRGDGIAPLPLTQNRQYWADGGSAPPYDPQRPCVVWNDSVPEGSYQTWTLTECSDIRTFVCQKYHFNQNHEPNATLPTQITPGKWRVSISVRRRPGQAEETCSVAVRVQSGLQIITGFSTNAAQDSPIADPIKESKENRMITYIYPNKPTTPLLTHSLIADPDKGIFHNATTYGVRVGCAHSWVSQTFTCPNGGGDMSNIYFSHVGEDGFGNMFQRMTYGRCNETELECENGGVLYKDKCYCPSYWKGRTCNVPICVNGGTQTNAKCKCPDGFDGFHCEYAKCTPQRPFDFDTSSKVLSIIIETTRQTVDIIRKVADSIKAIVKNAEKDHPNWFNHFHMVAFDSSGIQTRGTYYPVEAIVDALQREINYITDSGSCSYPIYRALQGALTIPYIGYPDSEMFIITMGSANDEGLRNNVSQLVDNLRAHVSSSLLIFKPRNLE